MLKMDLNFEQTLSNVNVCDNVWTKVALPVFAHKYLATKTIFLRDMCHFYLCLIYNYNS